MEAGGGSNSTVVIVIVLTINIIIIATIIKIMEETRWGCWPALLLWGLGLRCGGLARIGGTSRRGDDGGGCDDDGGDDDGGDEDGGDNDSVDDDGDDNDDDDIYIMMKCVSVCLSVTKNHHFLLGVSCNHLNPP